MLGFAPIASLPLASLFASTAVISNYTDAEWIRVPEEVRAMALEAEVRTIQISAELDMVVAPVYKVQTLEARLRKP
jgi:hypothetical protein